MSIANVCIASTIAGFFIAYAIELPFFSIALVALGTGLVFRTMAIMKISSRIMLASPGLWLGLIFLFSAFFPVLKAILLGIGTGVLLTLILELIFTDR